MNTRMAAGLSLDQAPPLAVPASFFLSAPLALVVTGFVLIGGGAMPFTSAALPGTSAALHLGTLGFLTMVMFGALYQMIPVVAGAPVPSIRSAHLVHGLLVLGTLSLVLGLEGMSSGLLWTAFGSLLVAITTFAVTTGLGLLRAPSKTDTVYGMRLASAGLLCLAGFGLWMVWTYASGQVPADRTGSIAAHASFGLLVWVGGLLVSVSWQILPMFYLTPSFYPEVTRRTLWAIAITGVALLALSLVGGRLVFAAAAPAAVAIWFVHPIAALILLGQRKRGRSDTSLTFWRAGLVLAPVTLVSALAALWFSDPRLPVLFGWIAVWGWAGLIVHGMLTRIVPFLTWFHRFAHLAGREPIPPIRHLLPDRLARIGLLIHVFTLAVGIISILLRSDFLSKMTGAGLCLTGISLLTSMSHALFYRRPRTS